MVRYRRQTKWTAWGLFLALLAPPAQAAVIDPELELTLRVAAPGAEFSVIVMLPRRVDPKTFADADRRTRRARLVQALKETADLASADVRDLAEKRGGTAIKNLWVGHAVAVTGRPELIRELSTLPGVESIRKDRVARTFSVKHLDARAVRAMGATRQSDARCVRSTALRESEIKPARSRSTSATYAATTTPEWNIGAIHASALWALGFKGQGIVVAGLDTGVDAEHPDLRAQYRGGVNSWFDPHGEHLCPTDRDGHGTQVMGLAVGRATSGTAIGVAPDAQWIAAKIFNDAGFSRESVMHQGLQWVLDPDGDPGTDDAPDIVNLSWTIAATNVCSRVFEDELDVLRASGIAVVLSAGNSGPGSSTSISPANNLGQLSVGSVGQHLELSTMSSRGPSACHGEPFPSVVAPGEDILAPDLSYGGMANYITVTGTSFAAPHVAGTLALLKSAAPTTEVGDLERALQATAVPAAELRSGMAPRLIDALVAYQTLAETMHRVSTREIFRPQE